MRAPHALGPAAPRSRLPVARQRLAAQRVRTERHACSRLRVKARHTFKVAL